MKLAGTILHDNLDLREKVPGDFSPPRCLFPFSSALKNTFTSLPSEGISLPADSQFHGPNFLSWGAIGKFLGKRKTQFWPFWRTPSSWVLCQGERAWFIKNNGFCVVSTAMWFFQLDLCGGRFVICNLKFQVLLCSEGWMLNSSPAILEGYYLELCCLLVFHL